MKQCNKCLEIKEDNEYYFNSYKNNYEARCRECDKKRVNEFVVNNRAIVKLRRSKYYARNSESIKQKVKEYRINKREKSNKSKREYRKNKRATDPIYRLHQNFRTAVWRSIKKNKNGSHWEDVVGYTLDDLKNHLEPQFKDGMTWDNYGEWEVDHKIPISLFNIQSIESHGFKSSWALVNLQPMWALENQKKGNKILY